MDNWVIGLMIGTGITTLIIRFLMERYVKKAKELKRRKGILHNDSEHDKISEGPYQLSEPGSCSTCDKMYKMLEQAGLTLRDLDKAMRYAPPYNRGLELDGEEERSSIPPRTDLPLVEFDTVEKQGREWKGE